MFILVDWQHFDTEFRLLADGAALKQVLPARFFHILLKKI